ncbi:hypothetical protein ACLMJK_004234 [Lecanora helva]
MSLISPSGIGNFFFPSTDKASSAKTLSTSGPIDLTAVIVFDDSSNKQSLDVGAGVGVLLGVLSLTCLGYLFWRWQRNRVGTQKADERGQSSYVVEHRIGQGENYEMSSRAAPQELEYAEHWPGELHSIPVHEAAEAF